jgi:hypothetical protein
LAREESQLAEAETLYSESLAIFREINDQSGLASCMSDLGSLAVFRGEYLLGAQLYQESLVVFGELGDKRGIAKVLEGFAGMASSRDRAEEALHLAGAATAVRNRLGVQPRQARRSATDSVVTAARVSLGTKADEIWKEGERMSLEKAIEYALGTAASDILASDATFYRH